jgi:hypothetical protein
MYGSAVTIGGATVVHGKKAQASADERPRTYGAGRVCATEGCGTVLSSYNPSAVCCLHSQGWTVKRSSVERRVRERPELVETCQNAQCGTEFVTTNPAKKYCSDRCRMQAFQARVAADRKGSVAA